MVEFDTHGKSDLVHTQNTSLALALACFVVDVELEPSSLDLLNIHATSIHLRYGVHE